MYASADFVVIETGNDERAPIILGRPFLNTSGAVIYASAAKISFYIKGRKETFYFMNKTTQISEQSRHEPRKRTNRRNRNKQMWTELSKMVTAVQGGQDHLFKSTFLTKMDDPGMLLGILNANRKIRKRTDTDVAFTREYSRVSIFHRERECTN